MQLIKDQSCWPSHQTPGVNRGYEAKQLRDDGTLATCTATCGAGVYRGGIFPKEFAGNVFIPEPAGNLVKRLIIDEKDAVLTARNAYGNTEFLTSTDERFRPVNAYTGPDGALYVVDMYRGIIQHKGFLTHYLIANIKDRKLEEPYNPGASGGSCRMACKPKPPSCRRSLPNSSSALGDKNGWVRDTAQRLLVERKDMAVAPALAALAKSGPSPVAKIHALWTLEGLGGLTPEVVTAALKDRDSKVRATAVRLADRTLAPEIAKLLDDPSMDVQVALGFYLGTFPETQENALALARSVRARRRSCATLSFPAFADASSRFSRRSSMTPAKPAPAEMLGAPGAGRS